MLQPIRHLLSRPGCFRLGRPSPDGIFTRGFDAPYQGAHNNIAENAVRPVVLGRKNYLFVGNDAGGQRAAILYSLIESCKSHGVNPVEYLTDVLTRISTHPAEKVADLAPRPLASPIRQKVISAVPIQDFMEAWMLERLRSALGNREQRDGPHDDLLPGRCLADDRKGLITSEEFVARMRQLDAADGKLDGKISQGQP